MICRRGDQSDCPTGSNLQLYAAGKVTIDIVSQEGKCLCRIEKESPIQRLPGT